jgi:PAS domain S-box-containing protein
MSETLNSSSTQNARLASHDYRRRVLLLTPIGRDGGLIADVLSRDGIVAQACANAAELTREIASGAGTIVVAEEALTPASVTALSDALRSQPAWSDLPLIVLSTGGESTPQLAFRLERLATPLRNAAVIERPVRPATLISVVNTALRSRDRQYEVEGLLNELRVTHERLRTMIESAKDYAIINLAPNGHVIYWNTGAERLLGYTEAEILGNPIDVIFREEDRREGIPARERETALKCGHADDERWHLRRDGSRFWASGVVRPTWDATGAVTGFIKVFRDMTEHKEAEERLAEQAKKLEQSNEDLQRFAYAASHDLQEPLRMIGSYSQLLARKNEDRLDQDSREFIRFIVSGVERMRTLIRDLLDFSRLTTENGRPAMPIDCNAILGLALQHLQVKITESGAKISFDRLPLVLAHDTRLLQVFQNLIGNALKYCEMKPEIHIWADREGNRWRIAVRDNGIGIPPEHQEKIFGLFQRLHSRSEYPGTGIGLASCKRIIEQEGGRIWVESTVGSGSTFYFTFRRPNQKITGRKRSGPLRV